MFSVAEILPRIPFILAYLAGLIVAIILAARYKTTPAILALVGFAAHMIIAEDYDPSLPPTWFLRVFKAFLPMCTPPESSTRSRAAPSVIGLRPAA